MRKTENIINRTGINKTECKKTVHSKENKIPGGWNGSLFFLIIILGITLGIFAGCKNIFVPEPPATPEAAGPGGGITVSLRLFTGSARSVMPGMEDLTWEITATSGGAEATVLGEYPDFKIYFPSKGKWAIEVKGKSGTESGAKEIFTGDTTLEITGSTVSISIPLSQGSGMADGTGTIYLTMTVPANVTRVKYKLDGESGFTDLTLTDGSCSLNKAGVSAGPHTLSLYFLDGNGMTVYMCTETVNVWSGVTSNQWIKTSGADYINGNGKFELTKEIIDNFLKTMGSVVYVDANVKDDEPATGSIFAPVKTVSTAVDILRKANPGGNYKGTIMVSGETTIEDEIKVKSGETLTIKGTGTGDSIKNISGRVFNIASGGSVTLGDGITLTGTVTGENARGGAVYVTGGNFTMESGSTIADSSVQGTSASGGGVYVMNGTFIMEDGSKITGSSATVSGGGVAVSTGGTFTMRGGTIDGTGASSNAESGGGVEIHDAIFTMEGGTITGNNATYGGGVRVDSGEFIMKDGTISDNNATNLGGGVCVINGSFTMSDTATIQGNTATTHGGGVHIFSGGTFTMNGGTIGGTAANTATYGGGVFVSGGEFNMNDGTISGNTVTHSGGGVYVYDGNFTMSGGTIGSSTDANEADLGGGVYVADGTFTVSGSSPTITGNTANNVYLARGKTISIGVDGLTGGTIGVTAEDMGPGKFVKITDETVDRADTIFTSDVEGYTIVESSGAVYLLDVETMYIVGSVKKMDTFEAALAAVNNSTNGGTITLLKDIDSSNAVFGASNNTPITFTGGTEASPIILDLNGKTINRELNAVQPNGSVIKIEGGALTIKDSSAAPDGTGGTGTITGGNSSNTGGGIHITTDSFNIPGSLILKSGSISGNTAAGSNGGGVYIYSGCAFTMKGGSIDDNTVKNSASSHGGGVFVYGTFTMENGIITKNSSKQGNGGGVNIGTNGNFTMSGGIISANNASMTGGGVNLGASDATMTLEGGTISGNTASYNGGGVGVSTGTFTMTGGTLSGNTATSGNGGGVYVHGNDSNFTMTGGTIGGTEPNTAVLGGGVYVGTGNFTLGSSITESSPVVSGNTKTSNSPNNVYLDTGKTLSITGKLEKAEVSGNMGISMATPGVFTSDWSKSGLTDTTFFFSDDTERNVALSGSELSLNLVRVEGGSCTLNGTEVTLSSFWISPYEVTQEEFESVMAGNTNGIAPNPSYFQNNPAAGEVQKRRPVELVRWYDAIVYCNLLSMKEGLTPCYTIKGFTNPATWGTFPTSDSAGDYAVLEPVTCNFDANGYRLPTEAEWEYAARGGKPGMANGSWDYTYSGSNTIDGVAWFGDNKGKTHEVGKKQANALGLYDMTGNVREWCWDWSGDNFPTETEDPTGPESGSIRVTRGGRFSSFESTCKVSERGSYKHYEKDYSNGIRVVRSIR